MYDPENDRIISLEISEDGKSITLRYKDSYGNPSEIKEIIFKSENTDNPFFSFKVNDYFKVFSISKHSPLNVYLSLENPTEKDFLSYLKSINCNIDSIQNLQWLPSVSIPMCSLGSEKHLEIFQNFKKQLIDKEEIRLKELEKKKLLNEQKKIAAAEKRKQSRIEAAKKLLREENILPE